MIVVPKTTWARKEGMVTLLRPEERHSGEGNKQRAGWCKKKAVGLHNRRAKEVGVERVFFLSFFNRLSPTRSPRLKFVKLTPNAPRSTSDIKIELASKRKKEKSSREEKSGSSFLIDGDEQSLSTASSTSPASFSTFPASLAPPAPLKCKKNPFPTETRTLVSRSQRNKLDAGEGKGGEEGRKKSEDFFSDLFKPDLTNLLQQIALTSVFLQSRVS